MSFREKALESFDAFRPNNTPSESSVPIPDGGTDRPSLELPPFYSASNISLNNSEIPPVLIEGILHRMCKALISGESKSRKSWAFIDMALSVAAGVDWLGFPTAKSDVLYLNFELLSGFFNRRVVSVAKAKDIQLPENLHIWNLRNICYDLQALIPLIQSRLPGIGLVIVDPIYKAMGEGDENSSSDVFELMLKIENMCHQTGASVIFGHHFSKGAQSNKNSKDRPSGSGVLVRDPDLIVTLTNHKDNDCYVIEMQTRYTAPVPPFVVEWAFPVFKRAEGKDPSELWEPQRKEKEAPKTASVEQVLELIPKEGATEDVIRHAYFTKHGTTNARLIDFLRQLVHSGRVEIRGRVYYPLT